MANARVDRWFVNIFLFQIFSIGLILILFARPSVTGAAIGLEGIEGVATLAGFMIMLVSGIVLSLRGKVE